MPTVTNNTAVVFNTGDRVRVTRFIEPDDSIYYYVGATGTVKLDAYQDSLLVLFDNDAFGNTDDWWINGAQLEKIDE